jgi:organic radical activating enzyme
MKKSRPYCYAPWTTVQYSGVFNGGGISPCCEWQGEKYTGDIKDYQGSKYLKKIKKAMINHDMSMIKESCAECIEQEKFSKSARNYIDRDLENGKYELDVVNKLDYRPDNLCNLKCRMCSMASSSLIEEEFSQHGFHPIEKRDTTDVLDFDLSNLKTLAILGGEPTVNKNMFPILDYLIDNNMTETTRLNYTTNCTSVNEPWMSRARQFKDNHINMSIDAAGKAYEYIRTNAVWSKVEKNIPKILDIAEDYSIQMVVQTNSFAIIEDWIEYFLQFPPDKVHMSPMMGIPGKLDCIPIDIKNEKIAYLKKLKHPTADQAIKHFEMDKSYNPAQVAKYIKYNGWLDSIRGTNILDLDPVFERIFGIQYDQYLEQISRKF